MARRKGRPYGERKQRNVFKRDEMSHTISFKFARCRGRVFIHRGAQLKFFRDSCSRISSQLAPQRMLLILQSINKRCLAACKLASGSIKE